jgi:hypothetical protein
MNPEWPHEIAYANVSKFEKFAKKHQREYEALFANLDRVLLYLRQGNKMGSFQIGFFRSEGGGVYRIGQTRVRNAQESRLYVFPNQDNQTMYSLNIGTKDGQTDDINEAKSIVETIRRALEAEQNIKQTGV